MTGPRWPPRHAGGPASTAVAVPRRAPDLEALTGIRSGKPSFYPEYRTSAERLRRVIHALDRISAALVRTVEGSEALVRAVVAAAADHLSAQWVVFALVDGELLDAAPRHLVLGPGGVEVADWSALPDGIRSHVEQATLGDRGHEHHHDTAERRRHAHVPVTLGGTVVGGFAAWTGPDREIDATDESVLRILAGQTAAALQNCALYQRAQRTQEELFAARQHQVLDSERHRIARELHDSVTQYALSAGMQIDLCRGEVDDPGLIDHLDTAKDLTRRAVEQLRSAIYALNDNDPEGKGLPTMLERLTGVHLPDELRVEVRIGGRPVPLPAAAEQSLFRIASEALFNTAVHAGASHALVRLSYRKERVVLTVADDGRGRAEEIRRSLRAANAGCPSGEHRGLANMATRARELGGALTLTKARMGGLQVQVSVPVAGA